PNPIKSASSPSNPEKTSGISNCPPRNRLLAAAKGKCEPGHQRKSNNAIPSCGRWVVKVHFPCSTLVSVGPFTLSSCPALSSRAYSSALGFCGLPIFFQDVYALLRSSSIRNSSSSAPSSDSGNPSTSIFTVLPGVATSSSL